MITTVELSKNFRRTQAVSSLKWHVPEGSIYGLLGQNGAGKSTTLRMLLGLVRPTRGEAHISGIDIRQDPVGVRQITGYIPEQKAVYRYTRVEDFMRFYGSFFPGFSPDFAKR